jgi:hypothetical protein
MSMSGGQASGGVVEEYRNAVWVRGRTRLVLAAGPVSPEARGPGACPSPVRVPPEKAGAVSQIFWGAGIKTLAVLLFVVMGAVLAGASLQSAIAVAVLLAAALASANRTGRASSGEPPVTSPNCWPQGWF